MRCTGADLVRSSSFSLAQRRSVNLEHLGAGAIQTVNPRGGDVDHIRAGGYCPYTPRSSPAITHRCLWVEHNLGSIESALTTTLYPASLYARPDLRRYDAMRPLLRRLAVYHFYPYLKPGLLWPTSMM